MINTCILEGRLTKDVELKKTQSNNSYCRLTIAVDRGADKGADFVNCVAWNKTAELICKYFAKGSPILVEGNIRTSSFESKNGKVFQTDVSIYKVHFPLTNKPRETKEETPQNMKTKEIDTSDMFYDETPIADDLPF